MSYLIVLNECCTLVPNNYAASAISKYTVLVYFREGTPWYNNAWTLVFIYIIVKDIRGGIEHDDSIIVIIYLIWWNPTVTTLYHKDTFTSRWVDFIFVDDGIRWTIAAKSNVSFIVGVYLILFDVCISPFHQ